MLSLARGGGAAERIDIPKFDIGGNIFNPDFAGHFGARLAAPHDAELSFRALVQNINHVAGLESEHRRIAGSLHGR